MSNSKQKEAKHYLGIDCGSVSVKLAVIDETGNVIWKDYRRTHGEPLKAFAEAISSLFEDMDSIEFESITTTGSARESIAKLIDCESVNEITSHGIAAAYYHPEAKSVIEIGGQDSKLILLEKASNGETAIIDSSMNDICAAGTGSFLDQQAFRMGITVEELSELAYNSVNPAKIAGRCSVFAKTDMIHFQQTGVAKEDLCSGLCEAAVRTFIENLVKGRQIKKPIIFQGGVARNAGMRKAFTKLLKVNIEDMIIPEYFDTMGAIGAALYAIRSGRTQKRSHSFLLERVTIAQLSNHKMSGLPPLTTARVLRPSYQLNKIENNRDFYVGIDVGSVSVKVVLINDAKEIKYTVYTAINGEPVEALKKSFAEILNVLGPGDFSVKGVGVTGSGRKYIANIVGADLVKNEITAQTTAAVMLVPDVDTIFEIGGQDAKYIRVKNGSIADFIMNKTCAAGTGSFLAEQANRLGTALNEEFSRLAMTSKNPVDMGTRCTVFMETDCIHYQQNNVPKEDILAGLSYSIAKNYLEKVCGNHPIGERIVFQGGVAFNASVVGAFTQLLNKDVIVAPHHEVTGALGMAFLAQKEMKKHNGPSRFHGFNIDNRIAEEKIINCSECANVCKLVSVKFDDDQEAVYGSNCGKFEQQEESRHFIPDYFTWREKLLLSYQDQKGNERIIGIPRMLQFYELFPLWATFFKEIGYSVELSDNYNKQIYEKGISYILTDTCFPIKSMYGAVENLRGKGVTKIFLPYVLNMYDESYDTNFAHNCQYIQQIPDFVKSSSLDIALITATFKLKDDRNIEKAFVEIGKQLGIPVKESIKASRKALTAQQEFVRICKEKGKEALKNFDSFERVFVVMGHPYITHDKFFNLNLARHLIKLGIPTIPADLLPLDMTITHSQKIDLVWKTNNKTINVAEYIHEYNTKHVNKLLPVLLTTFGCAADSMLVPYLADIFGSEPWLEIELDEHNSVTGVLTRCEAFWESATADRKNHNYAENYEKFKRRSVTLKDIVNDGRTLYVPPVSEAFTSLIEILRAHNVKCELVRETSSHSNMLGRKHSNEKHCRTYQVVLGDYLATTQMEGFDPNKAAFFSFGYNEACRLALFKDLHEKVLKETVGGDIWLFGPTVDNPLDWIKNFGLKLSLDLWIGLICHDYLSRYRYQIRPYEKVRGAADAAYHEAEQKLAKGIRENRIIKYFKAAMDLLKCVELEERDLVKIGIVGDAFTRVHKYGMNEIFKGIERMGGVVILPPSWHDFVSYGSVRLVKALWEKGNYPKAAMTFGGSFTLDFYKKRIEQIAGEYSEMFPDQDNEWLTVNASKYVNPDVAPVIPSMFIGKCVDFVEERNVDGLVNAHGFNCVLGKISTACYTKIRRDNGDIPMMTFIDDGLQQTNIKTRLESFMEQARAFRNRRINMSKAC